MTPPFQHSFADQLEGFYAQSSPALSKEPKLIYLNKTLTDELCLELGDDALLGLLSGNQLPKNTNSIAQAYAGHQFGQFNPQLGDGRALILGELEDKNGTLHDLCLKGSGRTPFSRGGDGKAALGPMLREVLIAEAMHALDIPTTRSLAVLTTGEDVYRQSIEPGAILARTAASHIRIGTFQFFAARGLNDKVKQLADYTIARHYPELSEITDPQEKYLDLLKLVCERQAKTIAKWMSVGFVHGVMNTDNMLISGETIDYGPCAFMDAYNPDTVFSSIDHAGRYAYKNQPSIAQWNLARFAECLIPIMSSETQQDTDSLIALVKHELTNFESFYQAEYLKIFSRKLGLDENINSEARKQLVDDWLQLLESQQADFTNAFRILSDAIDVTPTSLSNLFKESNALEEWLGRWRAQLKRSENNTRSIVDTMNNNNPWIIPRNHFVEEALQAAIDPKGSIDLSLFRELLDALENPFEQPNFKKYPYKEALTQPASASFNNGFMTFCGT